MPFTSFLSLILGIVGLLIGVGLGLLWRKKVVEAKIESIEELSQRMIEEAQKEAANIKKEAHLQAKGFSIPNDSGF